MMLRIKRLETKEAQGKCGGGGWLEKWGTTTAKDRGGASGSCGYASVQNDCDRGCQWLGRAVGWCSVCASETKQRDPSGKIYIELLLMRTISRRNATERKRGVDCAAEHRKPMASNLHAEACHK